MNHNGLYKSLYGHVYVCTINHSGLYSQFSLTYCVESPKHMQIWSGLCSRASQARKLTKPPKTADQPSSRWRRLTSAYQTCRLNNARSIRIARIPPGTLCFYCPAGLLPPKLNACVSCVPIEPEICPLHARVLREIFASLVTYRVPHSGVYT